MTTQEEIQFKLIKLKEAIGKSNNIKNVVKELLDKATTENVVGAKDFDRSLSRDQVFKVYSTRYRILESRGEHNEGFANLLKRLEEVDSASYLVITGLRVKDNLYIVFTDKDYQECFGIIC